MSTLFAARTGLAGTKQGLTEIDVSGGDHVLYDGTTGQEGVGLFTVGGGAIAFVDGFGTSHTITFPAWSSLDCGIREVKQTGTTATGIYVGWVS